MLEQGDSMRRRRKQLVEVSSAVRAGQSQKEQNGHTKNGEKSRREMSVGKSWAVVLKWLFLKIVWIAKSNFIYSFCFSLSNYPRNSSGIVNWN